MSAAQVLSSIESAYALLNGVVADSVDTLSVAISSEPDAQISSVLEHRRLIKADTVSATLLSDQSIDLINALLA